MPAGGLQADRGATDHTSAGPLVFIIKQRGAFRLHALDADALATGLEPGMALADARARAPGLRAVPHDPDGEMALMEKLANACDRYTPMVSIDPPDGLVLDIAGCTHLFGNEDALRQDAVRLMGNLQLQCRAGFADTPEAALALARYAQGKAQNETKAIHGLPLLALSQPADALLALRRAGFSTVGEIAVLPPKVLAARFGAGLVDRLNRLLGRIDSRITPRRLPDPILVERRFAEPVAHVETVMVVLGELLQQACAQLAERHQGGRRFAARLYRSDGAMRDLAVETGEPVRAPKILLRLIEERIDALADPLDPGFGFDLVRLAVPLVETLDAEQAPLDGRKALTGELAALLDRLGARLGAERFCRLVPQDSHIPERTTRLAPAADALAAPARWGAPPLGEPPLRPSTLFDPPERVEVLAEVPDGPPRQFRWRGKAYRIARQEGPERIAAEWWRRLDGHAGNPGLSRDYYRIEDEAGYRFWIFRHGLYGRETDQPHWYVHGLFA